MIGNITPLELTEENIKLYEENMQTINREETYDFYSNSDDNDNKNNK